MNMPLAKAVELVLKPIHLRGERIPCRRARPILLQVMAAVRDSAPAIS
jgi:hypothetical protein